MLSLSRKHADLDTKTSGNSHKDTCFLSATGLVCALAWILVGTPAQAQVSATQMTIGEVNFVGASNHALIQSVMQSKILPLGKSLAGTKVSNSDIDKIAADMSKMSRDAGLVVSRFLVSDADKVAAAKTGVLRFTVLEGEVGKVTVSTNTSKVSNVRIYKTVAAAVCESVDESGICIGHQSLTSSAIERATLNTNDIPGVNIGPINLNDKGVGVGQTHISVSATPAGDPLMYSIGLDNYGAKSIGRNRVVAAVNALNLMGEGDVLTGSLSATDKNLYSGNLNFSAPLGYSGLRGNVGLSSTYFTVNEVNLVGRSDGINAGLSYPILRAFDYNLRATAGASTGGGKSTFNGVTLGQSESDTFNLGLALDDGDRARVAGQSFTRAGVVVTSGKLTLKDAASVSQDAVSAKTQGNYVKASYNLVRKQNLTDQAADAPYLLVNLHGQMANKNLSGGEKLSSGGVTGVRAYPSDEISADEGAILQLDLRKAYAVGNTRVIAGIFLDAAQLTLHKTPWQGGVANKRNLYGYGLSLEVQPQGGFSLGLMWARRLGKEDSASEPGSKSHLWATVGMQF